MTGAAFHRPISLALIIAAVSVVPAHSGDIITPPPVFVPPPSGGVVDPVFVPEPPAPDNSVAPGRATNAATNSIVGAIDAARDFCQRVPSQEYTIDCLGDTLQSIAADIPAQGDYAEAKEALGDAARKLRSLANSNASRELPRGTVRVPGAGGRASSTPLTPVAREALAQSNAAAIAILEEAETVLLRSAANSAARKVHYQQIAQAVGSNKVLLRST